MALYDLAVHCKKLIQQYPEHKAEIIEIYICARDKADDGSENHAVELAFSDLRDLVVRIKKAV